MAIEGPRERLGEAPAAQWGGRVSAEQILAGAVAPNAIESAEPEDPSDGGRAATGAAHGPRHVAVIMDGNGRWAKARGLPRIEGHRRGARSVRRLVEVCPDFGVRYLTLYAFSTENWSRPPDEIKGLMNLLRLYLRREAAALRRNGVRVTFLGDPTPLAQDIQTLMRQVETETAEGRRLDLQIAINYGGRAEIASAARRLAERAAAGEIDASDVDESALADALQTSGAPDPDMVIRTSGEQRLSNFLLWQAAYAEFVFVPESWPEFTPEVFARALEVYRRRERRYGGVTALADEPASAEEREG